MRKSVPKVYQHERKLIKERSVDYLLFYLLVSCVVSYVTVFYLLPYILDISLLLSAIVWGGELGIAFVLTLLLFIKICSRVVSLIKNINIDFAEHVIHAKNIRYS